MLPSSGSVHQIWCLEIRYLLQSAVAVRLTTGDVNGSEWVKLYFTTYLKIHIVFWSPFCHKAIEVLILYIWIEQLDSFSIKDARSRHRRSQSRWWLFNNDEAFTKAQTTVKADTFTQTSTILSHMVAEPAQRWIPVLVKLCSTSLIHRSHDAQNFTLNVLFTPMSSSWSTFVNPPRLTTELLHYVGGKWSNSQSSGVLTEITQHLYRFWNSAHT